MEIEDIDNFLARAKGSRPEELGKSQGHFHYIGKINKEIIAIYHNKFTELSNLSHSLWALGQSIRGQTR